jgi:O-antigen ligase
VPDLHKYRTLARGVLAPDPPDKLDSVAFVALLIFVTTVPFFYGLSPGGGTRRAMGGGEVMPAGNMFVELFAFLVAAATFLSKSRLRSLRALAIPLGAVSGLAALGLLQLLPIPEKALERAAPANLKIYHESSNILGLFGRAPLLPRISIAPAATMGTMLLTLSYAALFVSTASLLRGRPRRRLFAILVVCTAVVQVLLAALREPAENRLHGVFVNADHFAAYLEIGLALAFGTLWAEILTGTDRARDSADRAERFEKRLLPLAVRILWWAVIAAGVGLTRSRGGILAAAITTAVLLTMALLHRRVRLDRKAAAGVGLALLAGIAFAGAMLGPRPFRRFLELDPRDLGANLRVTLWRTSLDAWREFPLLGSGLGTFREAFRRVQPRDLRGLVEQAHADSLQLLVTGGMIGAALGVLAFGSLFFLLVRAWRTQKHREESALTLSGFGALLSLTLHGLVDFNLSIPAIAATLACALGLAWSAATAR